jgi:hypothetical protein
LHFPAQLLSSDSIQSPPIRHTAAATGLVDNWEPLFEEDFEATFPQGPCAVYDVSNDGFERTWGKDNFRFSTGSWAGWPASAGADSVDPAVSNYPADLDSWLICGPFNLSYAQDFLVNFNRWMEINDADDHFFVGASTDGSTFRGLNWSGVSNWSTYHIWFQGVAGDDSVWVGWQFYSDGDGDQAAGVWLDALEVWRYNTPTQTCGSLDPGAKGIVLNPYEWLDNEELPIIRADDTVAADKLALAGVHWVRMVFRQRDSIVRHQEYDRIVDTLCARGISVLGVVNHETLVRQVFNDPASAVDYRHEFTGTVGFIADRYFDILFNEVDMWGSPGTPAIDKVVWYQYMDTGIDDPCTLLRSANGHVYVSSLDVVTEGAVDWWFGLYRGDKKTPKKTWCAYLAYPLTCEEFFSQHIYLPLVINNR